MACGRIYGGADMAGLLQSEGISPEAIQALLGNASVPEFHGTRSMLSFKNVHGRAPEHSYFRHMDIDEPGTDDLDDCYHQPEKKRRLTLNQVQFLEKSFEVENKLEPERKIQLARDLGLQPRQVAIWFQNRRARWKTKQLERDYETLKLSYDNLKGDHDNLMKEKEKLKAEVQVLKDKLVEKEGEKTKINMSEPKTNGRSNKQFQELDSDLGSEEKKPELRISTCKHEDICSTDSDVLDCDSSPRCTAEGRYYARVELADSTNRFELDNSDNSNAEDDEEEKACGFAKLGDNTCGFSFPVEEPHALWSWLF